MIIIIALSWVQAVMLSDVPDLIFYCMGYPHSDLYERQQHMITFRTYDGTSRDFSLRPRSGST
jgi:hypothetical protein